MGFVDSREVRVICTFEQLRWRVGGPRRERSFLATEETKKKKRAEMVKKYAEAGFPPAEPGMFTKKEEIVRLCRSVGMSLSDTGKKVGVTRERVRQIEAKAQRKVEGWQRRCLNGEEGIFRVLTAEELEVVASLFGSHEEVADGSA